MKKLLVITTVPDSLEAFFLHFARHFRQYGWQVDGMAHHATKSVACLEAFNQVWDVDVSRNPLDWRNLFVAPQQIQQAYLAESYDIVLVSTPVASFVGRYALNRFRCQERVKVIYTAQGLHFYQGAAWLRNFIFRSLEQIAAPWTDYLVAVNQEDEQSAHINRLAPTSNIRRIPGTGVDLDRFSRGRIAPEEIATVRQELDIPVDAPVLLSLAEFIPRKRHWDVLQAFTQIPRTDAYLVLAGEGPMKSEMQALAADLGIADRVRFVGFRTDAPRLIQASTATVLMSAQEGLPNCVMESMYLNVPVIGSNIRGTRDLLQNGSGLLVDVGDVATLAQAMTRIINDTDLREDIIQQAKRQLGAYDRPSVLAEYNALYEEVLNTLPGRQQSKAMPVLR